MKAELRKSKKVWKVYYQDETSIPTPVPVYDADGLQTDTIYCGTQSETMTEAHFQGQNQQEARDYAHWLGAEEVTVR